MPHKKEETVASVTHPWYSKRASDWEKFRDVFEGGRDFCEKYLRRFSKRETLPDFEERKKITYPPTHAKAVIKEIRNSIFQRMVDITRTDGPESYQTAIAGEGKGVDLAGSSMNNFIGLEVIDELMALGRVGVFVDKPQQLGLATKADSVGQQPYIYTYRTEDIRSWSFDHNNQLTHLLLRDHVNEVDGSTGLVSGWVHRFRVLKLIDGTVEVNFFDAEGQQIKPDSNSVELLGFDGEIAPNDTIILDLPEIPFVFFQITESLLTDIADYQIALLQLASSDMNYALKANFPFYTEQYDPAADMVGLMKPPASFDNTDDSLKQGEQAQNVSRTQSVKSGPTVGRRYGKGLERPGFINPSPEPLKVSMEKQKEMREELRQIANLTLNTIRSRSAESKKEDTVSKQEGLSAIGLELEAGERQIARFWTMYETSGKKPAAVIAYPNNYDLRSDEDRRVEADELTDMIPKTPSQTLKKELSKQSAKVLVGHKVSTKTMETIITEIEAAPIIATDPEVIRSDIEAGLLSVKSGSIARGYPEKEHELAKIDHADRAARIALAQSKANQAAVADLSGDSTDDSTGKQGQADPTLNDSSVDPTRGKGKS